MHTTFVLEYLCHSAYNPASTSESGSLTVGTAVQCGEHSEAKLASRAMCAAVDGSLREGRVLVRGRLSEEMIQDQLTPPHTPAPGFVY